MVETVYVAYYGYNYEGSTIVGVFDTEQEAEGRIDALEDYYGDYRMVEEIEVGSDVKVHI